MVLQGLPVSPGVAVGRAFVYAPFTPVISYETMPPGGEAEEDRRFKAALQDAGEEIAVLQRKMAAIDPDKAGIFEAHQDILTDIALIDEILQLLTGGKTCEAAVETVYDKYIQIFAEMDDDILKERCADFHDVKLRLLRVLLGGGQNDFSLITEPSIIVARDLLPSDTVTLDRTRVLALVTEVGGSTSHSAILARSFGIPALLGVAGALDAASRGGTLAVDAVEGKLIVDPDPAEIRRYEEKAERYRRELEELKKYEAIEPVTRDGWRIDVCLNIGALGEEEIAGEKYTDGVGLFRSEFLFMAGKELPTENEQFQVYKKAAGLYGKRQVILRSLDIGGDKTLDCMALPVEDNPFLGCRALRLCFQRIEVFKTQLRAALRASVFGNLSLMFPMVGSMDDLRRARAVLEEVKGELRLEGIPFNEAMPVGIMIEIPAIALMADLVVREVDFASVGTNDLCQYLMAVDRLNPSVAAYYQSYHPAMFRLIGAAARAFNAAGKSLSICGEMGGDPRAVAVFIGLGIRKFSMSRSNVARVKQMVSTITLEEARALAETALTMNTASEIEEYLKSKAGRL